MNPRPLCSFVIALLLWTSRPAAAIDAPELFVTGLNEANKLRIDLESRELHHAVLAHVYEFLHQTHTVLPPALTDLKNFHPEGIHGAIHGLSQDEMTLLWETSLEPFQGTWFGQWQSGRDHHDWHESETVNIALTNAVAVARQPVIQGRGFGWAALVEETVFKNTFVSLGTFVPFRSVKQPEPAIVAPAGRGRVIWITRINGEYRVYLGAVYRKNGFPEMAIAGFRFRRVPGAITFTAPGELGIYTHNEATAIRFRTLALRNSPPPQVAEQPRNVGGRWLCRDGAVDAENFRRAVAPHANAIYTKLSEFLTKYNKTPDVGEKVALQITRPSFVGQITTGLPEPASAVIGFESFKGFWFGIWGKGKFKSLTNHDWGQVDVRLAGNLQYRDGDIPLPGLPNARVTHRQFCVIGDGIAWNYIAEIGNRQFVILGAVMKFNGTSLEPIRPLVGVSDGKNGLIWILRSGTTTYDIFVEEAMKDDKGLIARYRLTNFQLRITGQKPVKAVYSRDVVRQAYYTPNPKMRAEFHEKAIFPVGRNSGGAQLNGYKGDFVPEPTPETDRCRNICSPPDMSAWPQFPFPSLIPQSGCRCLLLPAFPSLD